MQKKSTDPVLHQIKFLDNEGGAALHLEVESVVDFTVPVGKLHQVAVTFLNNSGDEEGGALCVWNSKVRVTNIKLIGNAGSAVFACNSNIRFYGEVHVDMNNGEI